MSYFIAYAGIDETLVIKEISGPDSDDYGRYETKKEAVNKYLNTLFVNLNYNHERVQSAFTELKKTNKRIKEAKKLLENL